MTASISAQTGGLFQIIGDLNAETVPHLLRTSEKLIAAETSRLHFDLAGVDRCDSAGVALLIEWTRQARSRNLPIEFENLPAQVQAIAKVSDLEDLFKLAN